MHNLSTFAARNDSIALAVPLGELHILGPFQGLQTHTVAYPPHTHGTVIGAR
jgi:hypothetical protein